VSGGRLDGGHGDTVAYLGSGEDDGGVARSDKCGRKRSGGFGHGLSGRRARRGERPSCRGSTVGTGWRQSECGHGALTSGPDAESGGWQVGPSCQ
jgi:hypothetical protein